MATRIDHIGIAVRNLDKEVQQFCEVLELGPGNIVIETLAGGKTRVAMLPVGESKIELLQALDPASPISQHIAINGEGLHHLAISVNNVDKLLAKLKENGYPLIDEKPRIGAGGNKIAFISSKGSGMLIELVQL